MTTLQITHADPHSSTPLRIQVWQDNVHPPEPCSPVAEYQIGQGESLAVAIREGQRVLVIEHTPGFTEQLARFRAAAPPASRVTTHDDINRALADIGAGTQE